MKIAKTEIDECKGKMSQCSALLRESDIKQIYAEQNKERAINFIIARNNPFVLMLARAWKCCADNYGVAFQDLVSAGCLALIKGTRKYKLARGSYFRYVGRYINSYIEAEFYKLCNCPRREGKRRHKNRERVNVYESLNQEVADYGDGDLLTLEDVVAQPNDEHNISTLVVNNLLERLKSANEKIHPLAFNIIEMRYGIGSKHAEKPLSLRKVAQTVNMSKDGVRKIENKALAFLSSI